MWISVDECGRNGIKWDQCGSMWMKKGEVLGKMADWSRQKPAFFIMRSRGAAALRLVGVELSNKKLNNIPK